MNRDHIQRTLRNAGFLCDLVASETESDYLVSAEPLSRSEARRAIAVLHAVGIDASDADHEHRPAMSWLWIRRGPASHRLTGRAAYDYALRHGFPLCKYADPVSGEATYDTRSHDDLYTARLVLADDPSLLYAEVRA